VGTLLDRAIGSASLLSSHLLDIIVKHNLVFALKKGTPQVCPSVLHPGSLLM
jgi:hypothetical protein